jgi:hypothetical protein
MNIEIRSMHIGSLYSDKYVSVKIPYDSKIRTSYIINDLFYYVVERSDLSINKDKNCDFFIKYLLNSNVSFIDDDFKYLDKQLVNSYNLSTHSNGKNISFDLIENNKPFLFYIKVEKTLDEERDKKITEIIQ